jgi:hypothetical protein
MYGNTLLIKLGLQDSIVLDFEIPLSSSCSLNSPEVIHQVQRMRKEMKAISVAFRLVHKLKGAK